MSRHMNRLAVSSLLLCLEGIEERLKRIIAIAYVGPLGSNRRRRWCSCIHQRCLHLPYEFLGQKTMNESPISHAIETRT